MFQIPNVYKYVKMMILLQQIYVVTLNSKVTS